ncbi:hypothetical protein PZ895_15160 [Mesorhizobium sp. YIM 152430]|uniref:hypothetical protein n=1 Tax=Mesorhizobium sp. YIM 152430 TaxID=3031761 RepID=UPI0023DC0653|nr:hypothetical protein [Mesorhizobium sp. YIM 152430]MDF1601099.1 hypothetical protein [Mesorhizobium sp. YIM 152430]
MKKTIAAVLITSFAASTAAFAQDAAQGDQSPRQMMRELRKEIRADGVDRERFAAFVTERTEARFDRLDADGDGQISREEFLAGIDNRVERQFARMDRNEDGMLTREDRPFRGAMRGERGNRTGKAERAAPAEQTDEAPAE